MKDRRKCYKKLKTIKINYVDGVFVIRGLDNLKVKPTYGWEMLKFRTLFGGRKCAVIGMVHVGALPGN